MWSLFRNFPVFSGKTKNRIKISSCIIRESTTLTKYRSFLRKLSSADQYKIIRMYFFFRTFKCTCFNQLFCILNETLVLKVYMHDKFALTIT